MVFPSGFLDELRSRLTLSSVAGRRLRLTRAGREFKAPCPFHQEKTPSFYINDHKGFFHCFGCGAHGDVIGFLMRSTNLSFIEAIEQLAAEAGLAVPQSTPEDKQRFEKQKSLYDLLEKATQWFEHHLQTPAGGAALAYLQKRGLDNATMARFRLGYAPKDGKELGRFLAKEGFSHPDLIESGLIKTSENTPNSYSFFRHRIIFPVADRRGRIVAFGGRILEGDGPKYINSPDTPLFHKGSLLYGLSRARQAATQNKPIIVVEGYMDVISLVCAGFEGAVAPLGTALTEQQISEVWKLFSSSPREPVVCFDGDSAGQRAAFRAVERTLPLLKPDHSLKIAFLPAGEDPDSLIRTQGVAAMEKALRAAWPLSETLWHMEKIGKDLSTPETKAGFRKALDHRIQTIVDPLVRSYYQQDMRQRLAKLLQSPPLFSSKKTASTPVRRRRLPEDPQILRYKMLLAALLLHPTLFNQVEEPLAQAIFVPEFIDALRAEIVLALESDSTLDTDALKRHLEKKGHEETLKTVLSPNILMQGNFLRPKMPIEQVLQGWFHIWDLIHNDQIKKDMKAAKKELAEHMKSEHFLRLTALQQAAQKNFYSKDDEEIA